MTFLVAENVSFYGFVPSEELELTKGNLLTTIKSVFKEFYVGFEFFINRHTSEYRSIVHLTVGANRGQDGDRIPMILLDTRNRLYVVCPINDHREHLYTHNIPMKIGQWYKLVVEQILIEEKVNNFKLRLVSLYQFQYFYQINLDGVLIHSVENKKPKIFDDVRVYAPNPWQTSLNGKIKNLEITERSQSQQGI